MTKGFTLLELSIVLVIIGLILGGITVGSNMVRSAELNSVISDVEKYKTSLHSFRLKYNAVPGDMENAEDYWGAANTDNGDGNRYISTNDESIDVWNHLALAELVSGEYSAVGTSCNENNCPQSTLSGTFYQMGSEHNSSDPDHLPVPLRNRVIIAANATASPLTFNGLLSNDDWADGEFNNSALPVEDAFSIDRKADDGNASTGSAIAWVCVTIAPTDIHNSTPFANWDYAFNSANGCMLYFTL